MKRINTLLFFAFLLLPVTACNLVDEFGNEYEPEFFGLELVSKLQQNVYKEADFCHEWEYKGTKTEIWIDGVVTEVRDGGLIPYNPMKFDADGTMVAQGMAGHWKYEYNHLFIDVSHTGGSNYFYKIDELSGKRMILREEDYPVGGPFKTFDQDPSGKHIFWVMTYERK